MNEDHREISLTMILLTRACGLVALLLVPVVVCNVFDRKDQISITNYLNLYRSKYARGEVTGFEQVSNMLIATWSDEAMSFAESYIKEHGCSDDTTTTFETDDYVVHLMKNIKSNFWNLCYEPGWYSEEDKMRQIMHPNINEFGCVYSGCLSGVLICAYRKRPKEEKKEIELKHGEPCSQCPEGTKCNFDKLCTRIARNNDYYKPLVLSFLNRLRAEIARGEKSKKIIDENGQEVKHVFSPATYMMEVKWDDEAVPVMEKMLEEGCKNVGYNPIQGEYVVYLEHSTTYVSPREMLYHLSVPLKWPFLNANLTKIAAGYEYCNGRVNYAYIMKKNVGCIDGSCKLYEEGPTCTKCPSDTNCNNGLCSQVLTTEAPETTTETATTESSLPIKSSQEVAIKNSISKTTREPSMTTDESSHNFNISFVLFTLFSIHLLIV